MKNAQFWRFDKNLENAKHEGREHFCLLFRTGVRQKECNEEKPEPQESFVEIF